jgi:hypothetical protein
MEKVIRNGKVAVLYSPGFEYDGSESVTTQYDNEFITA